ncbi:Splicing factor 3B subunit [Spathaspora sp. JA1]|nr:Splicing factor 3B subunit [Spathaspora sp. JA1]
MSTIFRKVQDSDRNPNATLYFGNIDPRVTELLMYELFIQFGPIRSINMPKDRIVKTHQGYGFVEFKSVNDVEYVLDILRGVRLFGKLVKLKRVDGTAAPVKTQIGREVQSEILPGYVDVGARLFVNNLHELIDEKFLSDTFGKFGTLIQQPMIQRNQDTGKSLGFAFLNFDLFENSDLAIKEMNGAVLMNLNIEVSYAFKGNKRQRHGDKVERLLAENANQNSKGKKRKKANN